MTALKFKIGDTIKVIKATDEEFDKSYLNKTGKILSFDFDGGCGESRPSDPMIRVEFGRKRPESFWKEELEKVA